MKPFTYAIPVLCLILAVDRHSNAQGLIMDDESYLRLPAKAPIIQKRTAGLTVLPPEISYKAYCPPPLNQGKGYGTCMAFALGYYLRTIMEARQRHETDPAKIKAMAFSPAYLYNEAKFSGDHDCTKGLSVDSAAKVLRERGIVPFSPLGYPACGVSTARFESQAKEHRIAETHRILNFDDEPDEKVAKLKNALAEGLPVVVSFFPTNSFTALQGSRWEPSAEDNEWIQKRHDRYSVDKKLGMAHALCVVGYKDDPSGGAFQVVNSWGSNWGEGGFCWIRYHDLARFTRYGLQLYPSFETGATYEVNGLQAGVSFEQKDAGSMPVQLDATATKTTGMLVYRMTQPYSFNTAFKFIVDNDRQAYLYALGTDEHTPTIVQKLFPQVSQSATGQLVQVHSALLAPGASVAYPPELFVELDNVPGTDYFILLFSNKPLQTVQIEKELTNRPAEPLLNRLQQAMLAQGMISPSAIRYDTSRINFSVLPSATGSIVPVLVLIKHE